MTKSPLLAKLIAATFLFSTLPLRVDAQVWTDQLIAPGHDGNESGGIAVAPDGNIIAAGIVDNTDDPGTIFMGYDMVVSKHSAADGSVLWRTTIDGLASGNDGAEAVAVD